MLALPKKPLVFLTELPLLHQVDDLRSTEPGPTSFFIFILIYIAEINYEVSRTTHIKRFTAVHRNRGTFYARNEGLTSKFNFYLSRPPDPVHSEFQMGCIIYTTFISK
jgi:hypothetical protein